MIKTLIVDDSQTVRELLQALINSDQELRVIGAVKSGEEALEFVRRHKPDIITMDLHMPGMSGMEVTRTIMSEDPIPIVIVTADKQQALDGFKLIEAGAVAVMETPAPGQPAYKSSVENLLKTLKSLAGLKLVKRMHRQTGTNAKVAAPLRLVQGAQPGWSDRIIVIGASTGGPQTIKAIINVLRPDFPLPIVVAQHMASGFLSAFASWLNESKTVKAKIAEEGDILQAGHLYLAADDCHTGIAANGKLYFSSDPKEYGMRPSVAFLYRSAVSCGKRIVAIQLTGMGRDGASELGLIKEAGGLTIAQDKETSIVFGMPCEAIKLGNATYVLPSTAIAPFLEALCELPGAHEKYSGEIRR